jgi:DNA invertase Pin-like site-specific DNA recombinase
MVVILYLRVSARSQDHNGNLQNQKRVLRRRLKKLGIPVIDCFSEVISGWMTDHHLGALRQAVRKARQLENTVILAVSADRCLRSRDFHTKNNPDALPTITEYERLKKLTRGVPLVTGLHPDMPWKEVRSYFTKWGQKTKGNKGGRPKYELQPPGNKKKIRKAKLPRVLELYRQGMNPSEIARTVDASRSTVSDWLVKYA